MQSLDALDVTFGQHGLSLRVHGFDLGEVGSRETILSNVDKSDLGLWTKLAAVLLASFFVKDFLSLLQQRLGVRFACLRRCVRDTAANEIENREIDSEQIADELVEIPVTLKHRCAQALHENGVVEDNFLEAASNPFKLCVGLVLGNGVHKFKTLDAHVVEVVQEGAIVLRLGA